MANELRVLLLIALCCLVGYSSSKSCYTQEHHPYRLFASKTAYDEIRAFTAREVNFPECTPKQFFLIARHGTRYPKASDIKKMKARLPEIRDLILAAAANGKGKMCRPDLELLKLWHIYIDISSDEKLAPTGEQEFKEIGHRFKARFPKILQSPNISSIDVRTTDTERTHSSAKYFLEGLVGSEERSSIPFVDDLNLLRFYKTCNQWKQKVDKNVVSLVEASKFKRSARMDEVKTDVSKRVGLKKQLKHDDIDLMYDMCRFESAWDPDVPSAWCTVFKPGDLKTLEYNEDIKYFYKHGYGHLINYQQACPPVKDIIEHMQAKMDNETSEPDALLRFSHSGMMLKLYGRLGFFKDSIPLMADNYKKQKSRKWRTSRIDAFASNLAFVLLECGSRYKVVAYFQEREILLPFCTSTPCSMEEFLAAYQDIAQECDVDQICKLSDKKIS